MSEVAYKILRNDTVGRYSVAARDLKEGEKIFSEKPFAIGPKPDTPPVCLGCYSLVDGTCFCTKCNWPVCGPQCENAPEHSNYECKVFRTANVKFQTVTDWTAPCLQYDCITPIRLLLAKEQDPERWEKEVKCMEPHMAFRKEKESLWTMNQVNVVNFIRGPCKLDARFDEALIQTVCGILEINSFEVRSVTGYAIRGIYPQMAISSHNCVANTSHSIDSSDQYTLTARATTAIQKDQELFCSYIYPLTPTLLRREYLKEYKFFDCNCARCADPTELGTHMSTLKCTKCDDGWIMSTNPLQAEADWCCTVCKFTSKGQTIRKVFATIQRDLDIAEEDMQCAESREQLLRKYRCVLHPRNAYMINLKHSLSQLYGRVEGYGLDDLPDILLERKIELCKELLRVFDVIEPGSSRIRGMTLYELHAPTILLARSYYNQGSIDQAELRKRLEEAISLLEQSSNILKTEPSTSAEGIIGQVALQSLAQLKENLDSLVENA